MAGVVFVLSIAGGIGIYASTARMLWSFSRDKGLPLSSQLVKVCVSEMNVVLRALVC